MFCSFCYFIASYFAFKSEVSLKFKRYIVPHHPKISKNNRTIALETKDYCILSEQHYSVRFGPNFNLFSHLIQQS